MAVVVINSCFYYSIGLCIYTNINNSQCHDTNYMQQILLGLFSFFVQKVRLFMPFSFPPFIDGALVYRYLL